MVENQDSLRYILSFKSPELYRKFLSTYEEVIKIYSEGDVVYTGNYGHGHCERIEDNLNHFLPKTTKIGLRGHEIFCLLSAIWLHDLELVFKKSGKRHQRALGYICEHHDDWDLDELYACAIEAICKNGDREKKEVIMLGEEFFSAEFFSALFKIADRLDLDCLNLPNELLAPWSKTIDKGDKGVFLLKKKFTPSVRIDSKHWIIEVSLMPNTEVTKKPEADKEIYQGIKARLNRDFEALKGVFKKYGLGYQKITFTSPLEEILIKPHLLPDKKQPYKFLNFYDTSDKDIFFGRDLEISRFIGLIMTKRLVVIYGEMGVGKTSLIKAGLIPKLEEQGIAVYTGCSSNLLYSIKTVIAKKAAGFVHSVDRFETLGNFLKKAAKEKEVIIFIDQFENFFKAIPETEQERFMNELIECISSESIQVRFVLALRKESFVQLSRFQDTLPQLFSQAYELGSLSVDDARGAIEEPARLFNFEYEPELLQLMLLDLKDDNGFIYPIDLQILCDRMVEGLDAALLKDRLPQDVRVEWYDSIGGAQGAISDYLEVVTNRLPEDLREASKKVLKAMAVYYETLDQVKAKDILSILRMEKFDLSPLLSALREANLIRRVAKDAYALSSEYLIKDVKERWVTKKDMELRTTIDSMDKGLEGWRKHRWLMDISRFGKIYLYREELPFTSEGLELILRSSLKFHGPIYFWTEKIGINLTQEILLSCLKDAEEEEMKRIVYYFGKNKSQLLRPLLGRLESSDARVRAAAAELLVEFNVPEVLDTLLLKTEDTVTRVALTAARALGCLIDEKMLGPFLVRLSSTQADEREIAANIMIELRSSQTLEPLLERVNDSSLQVRKAAVEALGNLGDIRALNSIIGRLKDPEAAVREVAACALGKLGHEKALEPLLRAFNDTNYQVRTSAIAALGQTKDVRAFDALLEMIKDTVLDVRQASAEAVVAIGGTASFKHLLERFYRGDWWVKEAAAYGLGLLGEDRCLEPLLEGMADPDWRIREASAKALGQLNKLDDSRAIEALLQGLKEDPNSKVRKSCILSLGRLNNYSLFATFLPDFHDPDSEVKEALSLALGRLGCKEVIPLLVSELENSDEKAKQASLAALVMVDENIYGPGAG